MNFLPPLILASASPRRQELLKSLGLEFAVVASAVEELHDETLGVAEVCRINAERKAADIAGRNPEAVVIGADTLVTLNRRIFGKPKSLEGAREMLKSLSGQEHQVATGVCLINRACGRQESFVDYTRVKFNSLTVQTIEDYIRTVPVLDKAGAYGIQQRGKLLVENICGSFSNVMGLPMEKLASLLRDWGYCPRNL